MSAQADGAGTSDGLADQAAQPVMDSAPCLSKPCLARPPTANRASRWRLEGLLCTDFSVAAYSRARRTLLRRQRPHLPRLPRLPPTGRPHRRSPRPTGLALSVARCFPCSCQMYLVPTAPRSRLLCSCGATRAAAAAPAHLHHRLPRLSRRHLRGEGFAGALLHRQEARWRAHAARARRDTGRHEGGGRRRR